MDIRILPVLAFMPLLAGCLGTAPSAPANWTVECPAAQPSSTVSRVAPEVKLQGVEVRSPYNGSSLAVLRADGSLAFDPFNSFAAPPASLLRGAAFDVVESSGAFGRVVHAGSSASAPLALEVVVTRFALDCRAEGGRVASAAVTLSLVGNRSVVSSSRGSAAAPVRDGDFSSAFSAAFADAMRSALGGLSAR